ncbi:MAG: T9SS type A sorting domain-containing protein, partial [Bacteroidota bacterium]|nr:T9SS type A sorting domain-containing protein [Bacteroidota bacterium]
TAAPHFVFGTQVIGGMRGKDPQLDDAHLISGNLTYDPLYEYRNVYATAMSEWLGIDDASIGEVLTASNGQTFSKISSWSKLGIFKTQSSSVGDNASSDAPGLMLMENYPNPVTNRTTIEYALPESMPVELGIFNTGGVEVARLVDQRQSAGIYKADFTPGNLPSGYYIYRLTTPKGEISKQMIVVK